MFDSVEDLQLWQRIVRREAYDLVNRQRQAGNDTPLLHVRMAGAELLCPTCSSEARPDDEDTATCGTCGTLSPLESTIAYSSFIHQTLHSGIRVRAAMTDGRGGSNIPHVSRPFPRVVVRLGSILVLAAVGGLRRSQLDELLSAQRPLVSRWLQKEVEEGDRRLAGKVPSNATGAEAAQAVLEATLGPLPTGFPNDDSLPYALEQVFHAASQYYKFRTTSMYVAFMADGIFLALRDRLEIGAFEPIPWKEAAGFARALDPDIRGDLVRDRYRGTEETISRALTTYLTENVRLVRSVFGRHRVTATITA